MSLNQENNKRIAKNTIYLYIRMFVTMGVGLFTSRVILNTLGVSDFGVYNVMGGIIGMLGYVNTLFSSGTSRFLTISLGKGDDEELKTTFSTTMGLCLISSIIVMLLGETVGFWFMSNKLNIDPARMDAALWVYQCALLSCCLSVLQTPYSASIMSHEKMNIYAYMSIFDVVMKLIIVYMLLWFDFDKLKLYAVLMFSVNLLSFLIYMAYCNHQFKECRLSYRMRGPLVKQMFTYSGWSMVGSLANVLNNSGVNVLLNIFFGTGVNAARGIALQVSNIVSKFYSNFQVAATPQIYKYYAKGDKESMADLICNNAKYCALLLLCMIIPISTNAYGLLFLWLGQVPEYTVSFVCLILMQILFQALDIPIGQGIMAVGRMKLPMTLTASMYLLVFPLSYIFIKLGAGPTITYVIFMFIYPVILALDLFVLHKYTGFEVNQYARKVLLPIFIVGLLGGILSIALNLALPSTVWCLVIVKAICSGVCVLLLSYIFGLSKDLRRQVNYKVSSYLRRLK